MNDFHPCPRCPLDFTTEAALDQHKQTCTPPEPPPAKAKRRDTGGDLEKLVKASIKKLRPSGLRVRKHGPEFAGRHHKGGRAEGHILGTAGLDFEGHLNGRWLAFDAKATTEKSFPLDNVKTHQAEQIEDAYSLSAIAFLLVEFTDLAGGPRVFALDWQGLAPWWVPYSKGVKGARASIPLAAFCPAGGKGVQAIEVQRIGKTQNLDLIGAIRAVFERAGCAA